ncbi:MAG TPA: NAD(P)-dependent alcohol dehydrogenase [Streptosporangiaceae bacterium]|jgi:NADPH:quinone reductase-like Zn-dependent oxidoreductase|nr:NAD(P)-dependent alcohol dehydrogenase [Streptosporangiaceae bacterium]
MKAFVLGSYGSSDHLDLTAVDTPVPAADEVLVRVRATSVNPYDWHHMRGEPRIARMMPGTLGLRAPKLRILGGDMAGQVEAVGEDVTEFRPGDDVFALLEQGGFAEYVSVPERLLARKPGNLSYEQAAAVPMAATTALLGLRDVARIEPGQKVLVNGASGGVGTFAVQIARALGARADAVCSLPNADLARSIGADDVIDYASQDFTRSGRRYDVLLDIAGSRPVFACRRVLAQRGTLVLIGGPAGRWLQPAGHMFSALAMAPLVSQRIAMADTVSCTARKQILMTLTTLIEDGKVTPVISRRYPFHDIQEAVRYQEQGHAAGKVVITI